MEFFSSLHRFIRLICDPLTGCQGESNRKPIKRSYWQQNLKSKSNNNNKKKALPAKTTNTHTQLKHTPTPTHSRHFSSQQSWWFEEIVPTEIPIWLLPFKPKIFMISNITSSSYDSLHYRIKSGHILYFSFCQQTRSNSEPIVRTSLEYGPTAWYIFFLCATKLRCRP